MMIFQKENKNKAGIYKIQNKLTGDFYIGSSIELYGRFRVHKSLLNNNNSESQILQRAWNKYGGDSFQLVVLEFVEKDLILLRKTEQKYINDMKPRYNIVLEVESPLSTKTKPRSKSHRENHSKSMKSSERVQSEEYKNSQSDKMKYLWNDDLEYRNSMLNSFSTASYKKNRSKASKRVWERCGVREKFSKSFHSGFLSGGRKNGIKNIEMVYEIRKLYDSGMKIQLIADKYGIGYNTVRRVAKRILYDWI